MNKIIVAIVALLMLASAPTSRVLILVDEWYRDHDLLLPEPNGHKIDRYMREVGQKDGKTTELLIFERIPGNDCFSVWTLLRDKYNQYHGTADPLEGAVLVGDIPVPTFHKAANPSCGEKTIPCEYFYMDLWDNNALPQPTVYPNWSQSDGPWVRWNGEYYTLDRDNYDGDGHLDIWVSRIYATNLLHLRAAGAQWGTFLEEYQIIDAYFNKVHNRMYTPVTTRRGFGMGYPPNCGFNPLSWFAALGNLGFTPLYYDNMADLKLNQAAAWQALLQSGRPGNSNWGAYQGTKFTYAPYQRNCQTGLSSGTYEWAAFFAHSNPYISVFHMYPEIGAYRVGGCFRNLLTSPAWTLNNSGGYQNGLYYEWNIQYEPDMCEAEWTCVVPTGRGGTYQLYMYWNVIPGSNSPNSYYNLFGHEYFSLVSEGILDQTTTASDNWNSIAIFDAEGLDTLVMRLHPNFNGFTHQNRCVADAVEFRMLNAEPWQNGHYYTVGYFVSEAPPGTKYKCKLAHTATLSRKPPNSTYWQVDNTAYTIQIKPSAVYNISTRGTKGFRCQNWYTRSFCEMQDDGGQSKVLFFEGVGCEIANYLVDDNLGLLYGMGHAGLTMIGNSYPNSGDNDYALYTTRLGSTNPVNCFGKAYLDYANRDFNDSWDNFILFGAGTLKARSYP